MGISPKDTLGKKEYPVIGQELNLATPDIPKGLSLCIVQN